MIDEKDWWTLKAMSKFGGSFVKKLADLAHSADPANYAKIRSTWGLYWDQYVIIGLRMQAEDEKAREHLMDKEHQNEGD